MEMADEVTLGPRRQHDIGSARKAWRRALTFTDDPERSAPTRGSVAGWSNVSIASSTQLTLSIRKAHQVYIARTVPEDLSTNWRACFTWSRSTRKSTRVRSGRKKRATLQSRTMRSRRSQRGI
jgi:hypothetical protein